MNTPGKYSKSDPKEKPAPNNPEKYIPAKPDQDNDPTDPNKQEIDPKKVDPTRIEEPNKIDPTRI